MNCLQATSMKLSKGIVMYTRRKNGNWLHSRKKLVGRDRTASIYHTTRTHYTLSIHFHYYNRNMQVTIGIYTTKQTSKGDNGDTGNLH
jgi:hypothetical protein